MLERKLDREGVKQGVGGEEGQARDQDHHRESPGPLMTPTLSSSGKSGPECNSLLPI